MDMRTREARVIRATRTSLVQHVGGSPISGASALIEQCAQLRLRLATMDRAFTEGGSAMTERDSKTYLAWSNSYCRALAQLGMQSPAARQLTDNEITDLFLRKQDDATT